MAETTLLLDEDVPLGMVDLLASRGVAAQSALRTPPRGLSDQAQLHRCAGLQWVLVTQNRRDFRRLHWLWSSLHTWELLRTPHGGIVTIYEQRPALIEAWAAAIADLLGSGVDLQGRMYLWRMSSGRWVREPLAWM